MLNSGFRIQLSSLLLLSFIIRIAIPYGNFIFIPIFLIGFVCSILVLIKGDFKSIIKLSFQYLYPIIILIIVLVLYFFITLNKPTILIKEILHSISGLVVLVILFIIIKSKDELLHVLKIFKWQLIYSAVLVSIVGFIKLYFQLKGFRSSFLNIRAYPEGISLTIDSNFFSLFILFGIILIVYELKNSHNLLRRILYQFILIIFTVSILLSTSRRGMIIGSAFPLVVYTVWVLSIFQKKTILKNLKDNTLIYGTTIILVIVIFYYIIFFTSPVKRNEWLSNSKYSKVEVQNYINLFTISTRSIFNGQTNYDDVNDEIWISNFDSSSPHSGWANGNYTPIYEFTGENVEIVPQNSIGAKVDKNVGSLNWKNNSYYYSKLFKNNVEKGRIYAVSIYCYVSNDFNGSWVRLSSHGHIHGLKVHDYDLTRRGQWQYLQNFFEGDSGSFYSRFSYSLLGENSFENLTGYVIFAYPELKILSYDPKDPASYMKIPFNRVSQLGGKNSEILPKNDVIGAKLDKTTLGKQWKNIYYTRTEFFKTYVQKGDSIRVSAYCYVSNDFNGNEVRIDLKGKIKGSTLNIYGLENKGKWLKLEVNGIVLENGIISGNLFFSQKDVRDYKNLIGYIIFAHPEIIILSSNRKQTQLISDIGLLHNDIIKASIFPFDIIVKNKIKDIDSSNFEMAFQKQMETDQFTGPRIDRWRFAVYLYRNEYNLIQKCFGNGFIYTKRYAGIFNITSGYDYPHNPFLSVLLYSGIVGLIIYLLVLCRAFYLYWLYRQEYLTLFLCFLATFFYSFFSGNNPFDPPVMGLFLVLPFFIHYFHQKDKMGEEGKKGIEMKG